jgi:hypothetical protein
MSGKCEGCLYLNDKDNTCHKNAPAVIQPAMATERWRAQWPMVYPTSDWCGEYRDKENQ